MATTTDVPRAVLDAAIEIIAESGVESLSMREVARRAQVSHQAPYHYFNDRAGIFAAISKEGFVQLEADLRRALQAEHPTISTARAYVKYAESHRAHFQVMFRTDISGTTSNTETREAADKAFAVLLELSLRANPRPQNERDAQLTPVLLWAVVHGLATLMVDGPLMSKVNGPIERHSDGDMNTEDLIQYVSEKLEMCFRG